MSWRRERTPAPLSPPGVKQFGVQRQAGPHDRHAQKGIEHRPGEGIMRFFGRIAVDDATTTWGTKVGSSAPHGRRR